MNFGFLIFPGLEELDLIGPWEMISFWSKYAAGPENCLMVAQSLAPVVCDKGMHMAGGKTAGRIQLGAEYYPSGKSYGMMHELAQAPVYVKQWYQKK